MLQVKSISTKNVLDYTNYKSVLLRVKRLVRRLVRNVSGAIKYECTAARVII